MVSGNVVKGSAKQERRRQAVPGMVQLSQAKQRRKGRNSMSKKKVIIKSYSWKPAAARFQDVDPQAVYEALEELRIECGGLLGPSDVVEAAKTQDHPLHPVFPWDDAEAARIGRESIAREVLRSIRVKIITPAKKEIDTRAFVSTPDPKAGGRTYNAVSHALESPEGRAVVLRQAWLQLRAWRDRYAELTELAEVFDAIDSVFLKRAS